MRVVSYNIHRAIGIESKRPSILAIGEVIKGLAPDVVALNEIVRVPLIANQPARLARALKMQRVFQRTTASWGMSFGNAVLVRGRITDNDGAMLPAEGAEPRNVLFADVDSEGFRFTFACTHLDVHGTPRSRQLEALPALLRAVRGQTRDGPEGRPAAEGDAQVEEGGPLVLAGDFNATQAELEQLAEASGLALSPAHPTFPSSAPRVALDRVLFSDHWRLADSIVVARPASDHAALVVDLDRVR